MNDLGPSQVPRPIDRRVTQRPEPVRRQLDEPRRDMAEADKGLPRRPATPQSPTSKDRAFSKLLIAIVMTVIVIIIGAVVWFASSGLLSSNQAAKEIDSSKYQMVALLNGQLYFGKLETAGSDHMKLTKVYYIEPSNSSQSEEETVEDSLDSADTSLKLIKLGDEVHGPEDKMIINSGQILYFENLKPDGKIAQLINSSGQ